MKLEEIKFDNNKSDFIKTKDSAFIIQYFPEAKIHWNKEYEVQLTNYYDINSDNIQLLSKSDPNHPISKIEISTQKMIDRIDRHIFYWIFLWELPTFFLRSIAVNKWTLYEFTKKELINFLDDKIQEGNAD